MFRSPSCTEEPATETTNDWHKLVDGDLSQWNNPYSYGESKLVDGEVLITELEDNTDASGHFGIQHHGEKGQTYRFRNLRVKKLP